MDYYTGKELLSPVIVKQNYGGYDERVNVIGEVQYDRREKIGNKSFNNVFAGTFKGEKVAVKRVQLMDSHDREVKNNKKLLNHPNIVQFKHYEEDDDFGYHKAA